MDDFIDSEIEKMKKRLQGCQGLAPLTAKIEKHDFSGEMRDLSQFYNNIINSLMSPPCISVTLFI